MQLIFIPFLVHLAEVGQASTISKPVSVISSAVSNAPMATPTRGEQFVDKHHHSQVNCYSAFIQIIHIPVIFDSTSVLIMLRVVRQLIIVIKVIHTWAKM